MIDFIRRLKNLVGRRGAKAGDLFHSLPARGADQGWNFSGPSGRETVLEVMGDLNRVLRDRGWAYTWTEVGRRSLTRCYFREGRGRVIVIVKAVGEAKPE